jgi:DNA-binding response OmpR family regulator
MDEGAVPAHIKRIRNKFESVGAPRRLITTVYDNGYRLDETAE